MPLKASTKDNFDYLNKLCNDNGIEIILPDLNKKKDKKDENKKKESKKN